MATRSKNFAKVKAFFDQGVWNEDRVSDAVERSWLTEAEYKEITGKKYSNE